MTIYFASYLFL